MPAHIIPNIANSLEKHLMGYCKFLAKSHYRHFKKTIIGIIEGASSLAALSRKTGTSERTLWHFFNESVFDEVGLLSQSVRVMDYYPQTKSSAQTYAILDYTSVFKTGKRFEWSDWLWNEESDEPDKYGHEQAIVLEYDPQKDLRKILGLRRFYHAEVLEATEYWKDDFEKKPVVASRLLTETRKLTPAKEVVIDAEFVNCFLVNRFEELHFSWTGRVKKSLIVTYAGKKKSLGTMVEDLILDNTLRWEKTHYREQEIEVFTMAVTIPSLSNRKVKIAVCKNSKGQLAFIGTSLLTRKATEIVIVYGYRWEIEVCLKDVKQNLSFGDYRMRSVGANLRWQIFTLIAANLMELVRKTKLESIQQTPSLSWFKRSIERMYSAARITLGIAIEFLKDLRNGGGQLIHSLKRSSELNRAKYYLYKGINLARL